jgi:hypothetical protein
VSRTNNPFTIGFRAARANLLPGLLIQALMVALVLAYYWWPASRSAFQALASAKAQWGYAFSFTVSVIAGALLPTLLKITLLQPGRPSRADLAEFLFLLVFWGLDGMIVDAFYRFQALIFGAHPDLLTIIKKVLVDQFLYNSLFAAPYAVSCYEFKNHHYRLATLRRIFTFDFYRTHAIPTLCATWVVWIPVTAAIYALPSLLQIPLFALALTFWVLMLAYITSRSHSAPSAPATPAPAVITPV